ncbi:low molecular weight protein-tyrosine-phosphatase [Lysobacter enzymogenes]|uniref:low molecular weight protein-tyrosine-phosphatase n=1 Tax=Lysobacter enzymogenes TaxID=69 RepID=UPI001A96B13B|nr:low molecular weight protein-tyrosine-phosphatase [Lysobacter enzymogenes]QQP97606.1 low molecular weight phosphotyrosine protein phosphatase [Lysobacter enzymogenes]
MRLLVVCLGNICRSPVAEGVLRARIEASSLRGLIELDSAGTGDWHVGEPPDRRSIANAAQHGIDISGLRARQLAAADYRECDWLLCADRANLRDVRARAPADATARSALLLDWCGSEHEGEVPDPYTGGAAQFEHVFQLLDRAADGAIARLRRELQQR